MASANASPPHAQTLRTRNRAATAGNSITQFLKRSTSFTIDKVAGSFGNSASAAAATGTSKSTSPPTIPERPTLFTQSSSSPSPPPLPPPMAQSNKLQSVRKPSGQTKPRPPLATAQPATVSKTRQPRRYNERVLASIKPELDGPFVNRGGRRHHAFPMKECPYPLACDREALDLDMTDQIHIYAIKGSNTLIDFKDRQCPRNVLDLGCGNGGWVISMAQEWEDSHFTGFDIVPLHPDVDPIDPGLAGRIEWTYGNFLLKPLPFDDETFDFIHIKEIARGVPEDKWDFIFEEVSRVLQPGGAVEIVEEDIIFPSVEPVQPRRKRRRKPHLSRASPEPISAVSALSPLVEKPSRKASAAASLLANDPSTSSISIHRTSTNVSVPSSRRMSSSQDLGEGSSKGSLSLHSESSHGRLSDPSNLKSYRPARVARASTSDLRPSATSDHRIPETPFATLPRRPFPSLPATPEIPLPPVQPPFRRATSTPQQALSRSATATTTFGRKSATEERAQLERLFEKVFERRFINMQPTSLLPSLLNIHFKRSTAGPPVIRYMPPARKKAQSGLLSQSAEPSGSMSSISPAVRKDLVAERMRYLFGYEGVATAAPRNSPSQPLARPHAKPDLIGGLASDPGNEPTGLSSSDNVADSGGPSSVQSNEDKDAERVKDLVATQLTVALHLHRCLGGVLACKEAMWDELMISRGWKESDFEDPNKAKIIRQERLEFDALVDRYRVAARARISLEDAIERGLKWKVPQKDERLAQMYRTLLGDPEEADAKEESDADSDVFTTESSSDDSDLPGLGVLDHVKDRASEEEMITGKPFRRVRFFAAFKAEAGEPAAVLRDFM